ncbi:MAG: MoxR family ATPase [Oscillospiraceae bacterium]|nr:MoxR family ATPase [Oscillospiraceae bacterium]
MVDNKNAYPQSSAFGAAEVVPEAKRILSEIKKAVIGKDDIILKVLICIIAKGHILIEDIPGVGKTTLAVAFSRALNLKHNRVQFTPDVLPSDVTGFSMYNKQTDSFEYKEGAAMCNLFLADEINRTSSKTQSALLEVMEEGAVTVDSVTHKCPKPYIVIATQNPIGSVGTQLLPESQLDRFMIRLTMGYPDINSEINIIKSRKGVNPVDTVCACADSQKIIAMQQAADNIHIDDRVLKYIADLVNATRNHPMLKLGVSPRGTVALAQASKALALLRSRDYVIPDDVKTMFGDVCTHRIVVNSKARIASITPAQVIEEIKCSVPSPRI